jgi:flagellar basal body-associated protein FliL
MELFKADEIGYRLYDELLKDEIEKDHDIKQSKPVEIMSKKNTENLKNDKQTNN